MAFDWKKMLAGVAPTIAGAIGGPAAKAALQAVSNAILGRPDAPESELEAALRNGATVEQLQALASAESEFKLALEKIGVDLAKLEVEDRSSARKRQVDMHDWVPAVLAVIVHVLLAGLLFAMFTRAIPHENKSAADILVGVLGGGVVSVWSYYFGSSIGSKIKTGALAREK